MVYYLNMTDGVLNLSSSRLDDNKGTLLRKTFAVDVQKDAFPLLAVCVCVFMYVHLCMRTCLCVFV
jgi:hypothetical protein